VGIEILMGFCEMVGGSIQCVGELGASETRSYEL
jgi:hypothetical protein